MSHSFDLRVVLPFDWQSLLDFLKRRAVPGVETVSDSSYSRVFATATPPGRLTATFDRVKARIQVSHSGGSETAHEIKARLQQLFRSDTSTRAAEAFLGADRRLGRWVRRQPGLRVPGGWNAFEVAVRAVIGQQITVAAATTLMGRLVRIAGTRAGESNWLFPTPAAVAAADLGRLGMPRKRAETVRSLAAFFAEHGDSWLVRPEAGQMLLGLPGIGPWTAGYILMRAGCAHDDWPVGDLVLRKALGGHGHVLSHAALDKLFSRWNPYRSLATIHIWKGYTDGQKASANPLAFSNRHRRK